MAFFSPSSSDRAAAELARQEAQSDRKFLDSPLYFFELRIPPAAARGGVTKYLYPLVLGPDAHVEVTPFAYSLSFTGAGGVHAEERGVLVRSIRIRGTTGFKPKLVGPGAAFVPPNVPSSRHAARNYKSTPNLAVSGPRAFQFLQDRVFSTYGELKRQPIYAAGTQLRFHSPKDDDHFIVIPDQFVMVRSAATERHTYRYDITLIAVAPADGESPSLKFPSGRETSVLNDMRDKFRSVQRAVNAARAAVDDVQGYIAEIEQTYREAGQIIGSVTSLLAEVDDLVQSTVSSAARIVTELPDRAFALASRVNSIIEAIETAPQRFSDEVEFSFRQLKLELERLSLPDFTQSAAGLTTKTKSAVARSRLFVDSTDTTQSGLFGLGPTGANKPGDARRAQDQPSETESVTLHALPVTVRPNDTLPGLAARYLEDAGQWVKIAELNGLSPPFITEQRLPGTLRGGDTILIPQEGGSEQTATPAVFGAHPDDPAEVRQLGVDVKAIETPEGETWAFSAALDDFDVVSGVANVQQAVRTRVLEIQGDIAPFPELGTNIKIGSKNLFVERAEVEIEVSSAVQADPRVERVLNLTTTGSTPDTIQTEFDVLLTSVSTPQTIVIPH